MEASEDIPIQYQQRQPYMPPRKDDSQTVTTILVIVTILVVVQLVFTVLIYLAVLDLDRSTWNGGTPPPVTEPVGQFASAYATSNTTATVEFAGFSVNPAPIYLKIILERGTESGTYSFPVNNDGVVLILQAGTRLATITYRDYADNELVNSGDHLRLTGLTPASTYTVRMIWAPTGSLLDVEQFSLPA